MSDTPEADIKMTPTKPYVIRAFYEWLLDNNTTPVIMVNANMPNVIVPQKYIEEDGVIVLNIAPMAVHQLVINNMEVKFKARFDEAIMEVWVPCYAVQAIYALENGQGMFFEDEAPTEYEFSPVEKGIDTASSKTTSTKPTLTIVK